MEFENEFLAKIISKDEEFLILERNTILSNEDSVTFDYETTGINKITLEFLKTNFNDVVLNRFKLLKLSSDKKLPKILGLIKFSESKM